MLIVEDEEEGRKQTKHEEASSSYRGLLLYLPMALLTNMYKKIFFTILGHNTCYTTVSVQSTNSLANSCLVTGYMHSMQRVSHIGKTTGLMLSAVTAQKNTDASDSTQSMCNKAALSENQSPHFLVTKHLQ